MKRFIFFAVILLAVLSGCGGGNNGKNDNGNNPARIWGKVLSPGLYVGGQRQNGTVEVPCYWDNNGVHDLSTHKGAVSSVFLYNNKLYLGGYYLNDNGIEVACYWDNDGKHDLSDGTQNSQINSIYVNSKGIYAGGYYNLNMNHFGNSVACYWDCNGTKHDLPTSQPDNYALVQSIFVYDNVVYAAGYEANGKDRSYLCYWNNSGVHQITDGYAAWSIFVNNNGLYISGDSEKGASYWDNQQIEQNIINSGFSYGYAIFIYNDEIYVGGNYLSGSTNIAFYWYNNEKQDLDNNATVSSIFVNNNGFYAGGCYENDACYWDTNGRHILGDGIDASVATSIYGQ